VSEDRVPAHMARVLALLRAQERSDAAGTLAKMLSAPAKASPAVYVAGEAKRGKSTLVNALLSNAQLSPVGVEATTAVPVTFFFSAQPCANVFRYGDPEPHAAEVDRARILATVEGSVGGEENVRAVSIGVDSPLLTVMSVVDTPGVGGLESGHGALTLQSLHNAEALIFVLDATAPVRAAELEFLRRASDRIDTVIMVMTRIDASRGWRTILDDDMAIIHERAPRFAGCPVAAVSGRLALRGLMSTDPDEARDLREESGLTKLEAVLRSTVTGRAGVIRDANIVRAAVGPLTALERACQQRTAALSPSEAGRQALEAEQRRLQQLNRDRADWPQVLDAEIRKLTLERQEAVGRQTMELRHRYDERLKKLEKKDFEQMPGEFVADLTALGSSINETAVERLSAIVGSVLIDVDGAKALQETIGQLTEQSVKDDLDEMALGPYEPTHFEKLSLLSSFSTGRSIAQLFSGSGLGITAGALIAPPFGLALGIGLGSLFVVQAYRARSRQAFSAEFGPWMRDQISNAQITLNNVFSRDMIDFQGQVRSAIRDALTAREAEITETLAAARRTVDQEAGTLQRARQDIAERLEEVRKSKQETLHLLADLAREPAAGAGP